MLPGTYDADNIQNNNVPIITHNSFGMSNMSLNKINQSGYKDFSPLITDSNQKA